MTKTSEQLVEEPCTVTGGPHCYHSEEEYDDDGNMLSWDDYCCVCGHYRDWEKLPYQEPYKPT